MLQIRNDATMQNFRRELSKLEDTVLKTQEFSPERMKAFNERLKVSFKFKFFELLSETFIKATVYYKAKEHPLTLSINIVCSYKTSEELDVLQDSGATPRRNPILDHHNK